MRRTDPEERIVDVSDAADAIIVPQDESIVSITIDNQGPNDVTISLVKPIVAGRGVRIQPGDPPKSYELQKHGTVVSRGIFGRCAAAQTAVVTIWISYLREK